MQILEAEEIVPVVPSVSPVFSMALTLYLFQGA